MEILGLFINLVVLFWLFLYSTLTYKELPKKIPIHFGLNGKADGYSKKLFYWLLPMLGLLMFILIFYSDTHIRNLKLNQLTIGPNWQDQLSQQVPFLINVFVLLCFLDVQSSIYKVATKQAEKIDKSVWIWVIIILIISITLAVFFKE